MSGLDNLFSLEGRVALVTGASRGLGFAMAEALAEAGANVVINGRGKAGAEAAAAGLRKRGLKAEPAAFDVTDREAAAAAVDAIVGAQRPARHLHRQCRAHPPRRARRLDARGLERDAHDPCERELLPRPEGRGADARQPARPHHLHELDHRAQGPRHRPRLCRGKERARRPRALARRRARRGRHHLQFDRARLFRDAT